MARKIRLDVTVAVGPVTTDVHLTSPEALQWVERHVELRHRVVVTSVTWPNALATDITAAMEKGGLVVNRQEENAGLTVKIIPNERGNPPGKLADAELEFTDGPLEGLRLIGFGIWERRGGGRTVTFPARQYSVNGERRSFALLRPVADVEAQERVRDLILEAYAAHEGSGGAQ
jgi:hypothetical protein